MKHMICVFCFLGAFVSAASAQRARELTFFSNPGFSGAQFTVTGPRTSLNIPFSPRSAILRGGGGWEVCSRRDYSGECVTVRTNERDLRLAGSRALSARPAGMPQTPWREIARLSVRDRAEQDTASLRSSERFKELMVCAERNTVRLRRAEVRSENGRWQRLFLPLALPAGECSKGIALQGAPRLRAIRFEYETWSAGVAGGTIIVRALPLPERQPR
jgi:hypothetical protein